MKHNTERRNEGEGLDALLVAPGEIMIVKSGAVLAAVAARSVVVCLWNKDAAVAGACHFTQPSIYDENRATGVFGNVAVPQLLKMISKQSAGAAFEAHIIGGAASDVTDLIGAQNVSMAKKVLTSRGIEIVSEDTGGTKGRKIVFDTQSGHCAVIKVHTLRLQDWH